MKGEETRLFTLGRKTRKGAKHQRIQMPPSVRTDSARRLRWLLGFALDSSGLRTPTERRTMCNQVGAYLDGLLIRRAGQKGESSRVMELGDPRIPEDFPMTGKDKLKPLEAKLALIRTNVRRVVHAFFSVPKVSLRITGEIEWQRILEKDPGRTPTVRERWVAADVREAITFRLLEDLIQAGTLIRRCPATGCGRVFVRRYRQEFCSTACRNRTNVRIWYQRRRKAKKGIVMSLHAKRRKRFMHLRRARIMRNQTRRIKSA